MSPVIVWGLVLLGIGSILTPLVTKGGFSLRWLFRRRAFGSSQWAPLRHLQSLGMTKRGGLFLGEWRGFFGLVKRDIYHNGEGHLITIAGSGGGKSTGLVVPSLCELTEGSVIVTDPSGELAAMTARRRGEIGPVVYLNPFKSVFDLDTGLDFPDHGFNPMKSLDPESPNFASDVNAFARLLMVTDRKESGSYWNDEGAEFLSLMTAATILYDTPKHHNLTALYRRVRDDDDETERFLEFVRNEGHPAFMDEAVKFLNILRKAPPQWTGITSKAQLATKRYAPSTPLGEHTKRDGFDARRLKTDNLTVFILVPPSMLAVALPWMNLLTGVFGAAIGQPGPRSPVTMLIDEAPALGYLPDLQSHMQQFRKVGLRVWLFSQTYAALAGSDLYGPEGMKNIMGLTTVKQLFAVEEPETQELVSKLAGQRSVLNASSTGNLGDVGQPLIRPDEVRGLKKWRQIIIRGGLMFPVRAKLVPYFTRQRWRDMTDPNPYRS